MTMKCFVVSPIGKVGSETRNRSDGFLDEVIRPVAQEAGYEVERADEDKSPGMVTESIINKIIDADLVIVDLHGHNPNVMYEVAVRHATGKPLVQMIQHDEVLPFDIGGINTVMYDPSVRGLRQWRDDLKAAVKSSSTSGTSNPVVRAGLMRTLQKQDNPQGEMLQLVLGEMESLRSEVRNAKEVTAVRGRTNVVRSETRSRFDELLDYANMLYSGPSVEFDLSVNPLALIAKGMNSGKVDALRLSPPPVTGFDKPYLQKAMQMIDEFAKPIVMREELL